MTKKHCYWKNGNHISWVRRSCLAECYWKKDSYLNIISLLACNRTANVELDLPNTFLIVMEDWPPANSFTLHWQVDKVRTSERLNPNKNK